MTLPAARSSSRGSSRLLSGHDRRAHQAQFDKLSWRGQRMDHTINGNHDLVALEDVSTRRSAHAALAAGEEDDLHGHRAGARCRQPVPAGPSLLSRRPKKLTADLLKTDYAGGGLEALMLEQPHATRSSPPPTRTSSRTCGAAARRASSFRASRKRKDRDDEDLHEPPRGAQPELGGITDAALESSFLLEAIGNAKTVYNNNLSRFGKWMAAHFDKSNKILGKDPIVRRCRAPRPRPALCTPRTHGLVCTFTPSPSSVVLAATCSSSRASSAPARDNYHISTTCSRARAPRSRRSLRSRAASPTTSTSAQATRTQGWTTRPAGRR